MVAIASPSVLVCSVTAVTSSNMVTSRLMVRPSVADSGSLLLCPRLHRARRDGCCTRYAAIEAGGGWLRPPPERRAGRGPAPPPEGGRLFARVGCSILAARARGRGQPFAPLFGGRPRLRIGLARVT